MKNLLISGLGLVIILFSGCEERNLNKGNLLFIKGGIFKNKYTNLYGKDVQIADFYLEKYEVNQKEWVEIMGTNPSKFKGDSLPVETVDWYDCIDYCNKRSLKEGLTPYYLIEKKKKDSSNYNQSDNKKLLVNFNSQSDGYRLPTEVEWEYAASGGAKSKNYLYSGSNNINEVAWYWRNAGSSYLKGTWVWKDIEHNNSQTKKIGLKLPNELGIYDMSGNVREWCEDWYRDEKIKPGSVRVVRGGGWVGVEDMCKVAERSYHTANGKARDTGFRLCRTKL
nr:SUMF1/EgtB/PvdO family nonheme iron enzyme [uncultured Pedobacter sp.]